MNKSLKNQILESQKNRKEQLTKEIISDIGLIRDAMFKDKNIGIFKKFVLVGESPWNDGEDQYHRLDYSFGYISKDGEDYDECLEKCTIFSELYDEFIDEKYQGSGGVWEYVSNLSDDGIDEVQAIYNKPSVVAKEYAELLDNLCKELKQTNFILTLTYGSVKLNLNHDPDY